MSRLKIPSPHTFTHKRPTSTIVSNRKVQGTPTTVEIKVPGLMAPGGTSDFGTPFGAIEVLQDMIFLEAEDNNGDTRQVRIGDLLIHEDTGNVWRATAPGNVFENPALYRSGRKVGHHIQVNVERADAEAMHL